MDDGGTEEGSTSDTVLERPALQPSPSCLSVDAKRISSLRFGACQHFVVVLI
jgi:hypothetical protein